METECSLPCSLKSATCCILREVNPVHAPPHCFLEEPFVILSPHLRLVLRSGLFPSRFPTKTGFQITHTHTQTQKIDQLQTVSRCKTLPSMPVSTVLLTDQSWLCITTTICSHSLPLYITTTICSHSLPLYITTTICSQSLPLYRHYHHIYHHLHASRSFCYQIHTPTHTFNICNLLTFSKSADCSRNS